jgi:hypothetical protein
MQFRLEGIGAVVNDQAALNLIEQEKAATALACLRGVCHHSPDSVKCVVERQRKNWDSHSFFMAFISFGYELTYEEDYERCVDCGALMQYNPWDQDFIDLEPHSFTCFITKDRRITNKVPMR